MFTHDSHRVSLDTVAYMPVVDITCNRKLLCATKALPESRGNDLRRGEGGHGTNSNNSRNSARASYTHPTTRQMVDSTTKVYGEHSRFALEALGGRGRGAWTGQCQ